MGVVLGVIADLVAFVIDAAHDLRELLDEGAREEEGAAEPPGLKGLEHI